MNKYFLICFTFLLLFFCESCRYEEGPLISFRPRTLRLRGNWKIYSFTANGADSMNYIYRNHFEGNWYLDDAPETPQFDITIDGINDYGGDYDTDYHKSIWFRTYNNPPQGDWILKQEWEIIRLKTGDMKWRKTYHGVEYILHFKF